MLRALLAVVVFALVSGCSHAKPMLDLASPDAVSVLNFGVALGAEFQRNEQLPPSLRVPEATDQLSQGALNYYADQAGYQRPYPGPDLVEFLKMQPLRFEHVAMVVSAVETAIQVAKFVGPILKIYTDLLLVIPRLFIGR
ncbi:MAG: hypothetical protein AB1938_05685 [Myxococcota bacterium]